LPHERGNLLCLRRKRRERILHVLFSSPSSYNEERKKKERKRRTPLPDRGGKDPARQDGRGAIGGTRALRKYIGGGRERKGGS